MGILVDHNTRFLVQGITGNRGIVFTQKMLDYNTNVVAGVTPGKGGDWVLGGKIPVFDLVMRAVEVTEANASIVFVPPRFAADAIIEAADAGLALVVCLTEGIPVRDMMRVRSYLKKSATRLIGPNSLGVIAPGEAVAGSFPDQITFPGSIGVVSRSGTLTYEVVHSLSKAGIGVSTCVGIGGDMVYGMTFIDVLELFEADPQTEQVVLIGEIGGSGEEDAAEYIMSNMTKPVVALVAGQTAIPERGMGHAGAIINNDKGQAATKLKAFWEAGIRIATGPDEVPEMLA
jgi:succinyl-CoA synthetase alpha subunit